MKSLTTYSFYKRLGLGLSTLLLVAFQLISAIPVGAQVYDDEKPHFRLEAEWVDRSTIKVTAMEFLDNEYLDGKFESRRDEVNQKLRENALGNYTDDVLSDHVYVFAKNTGCGEGNSRSSFDISNQPGSSNVSKFNPERNEVLLFSGHIHINLAGEGCTTSPLKDNGFLGGNRIIPFSPKQFDRSRMWFKAKNSTTLVRVDGKEGDFVQDSINKRTFAVNHDGCIVRVELLEDPKTGPGELTSGKHETCKGDFADPANVMFNIQGQADVTDPNVAVTKDTCNTKNEGALSWLLCGFVEAFDTVTSTILKAVDGLLSLDQNTFNNNDYRVIWSYFRNVASFLLILVGLVMVIGQAVSKE